MKNIIIASVIVASSLTLVGCNQPSKPKGSKAPISSQKADMKTSENYKAYSLAAVPADEPYVLFFYADWCPTCVKWEKRFLGHEGFDDDVMVLKVDYDKETELAKQYGVKKQSTAVFIDAEGNVVKTESDPKPEVLSAFFEAFEESEESDDEDKEDQENTDTVDLDVVDDVLAIEPSEGAEDAETAAANEEDQVAVTDQDAAAEVTESEVVVEDEIVAPEVTTEEEVVAEEISVAAPAQYVAYSAAAVPTEQAYALYFHADWCPTCVATGREIEAAIGDLPAGTIVLKTDYDAETALKKQYGVTDKHTLVTINADGSIANVKQGADVDDIRTFFQ